MVAIKPKRFSEAHPNDFAELAYVLGEISGKRLFNCGKCSWPIHTEKGQERPKFCRKCGTEIDWVDFFTKIIKVCSSCGKEYSEEVNFCEFDGKKLEEKPVPKE